jgi:hypothetical protein
VKEEDIGSEPSELPEPEWYLEQFRSHVSTIHELFKDCPPQQWKTLSLAIGDALAEVGEKIGLKVDLHVQTGDKEP